MDIVTCHYSE